MKKEKNPLQTAFKKECEQRALHIPNTVNVILWRLFFPTRWRYFQQRMIMGVSTGIAGRMAAEHDKKDILDWQNKMKYDIDNQVDKLITRY